MRQKVQKSESHVADEQPIFIIPMYGSSHVGCCLCSQPSAFPPFQLKINVLSNVLSLTSYMPVLLQTLHHKLYSAFSVNLPCFKVMPLILMCFITLLTFTDSFFYFLFLKSSGKNNTINKSCGKQFI